MTPDQRAHICSCIPAPKRAAVRALVEEANAILHGCAITPIQIKVAHFEADGLVLFLGVADHTGSQIGVRFWTAFLSAHVIVNRLLTDFMVYRTATIAAAIGLDDDDADLPEPVDCDADDARITHPGGRA